MPTKVYLVLLGGVCYGVFYSPDSALERATSITNELSEGVGGRDIFPHDIVVPMEVE